MCLARARGQGDLQDTSLPPAQIADGHPNPQPSCAHDLRSIYAQHNSSPLQHTIIHLRMAPPGPWHAWAKTKIQQIKCELKFYLCWCFYLVRLWATC